MKNKLLILFLLTMVSFGATAQNHDDFLRDVSSQQSNSGKYSTWSGTIRLGGGLYGTMYSYITPVTVGLLRAFKFTEWTGKDFQNWSSEQHGAFRFFNIGGDILVPNWSMTATNANIELLRPLEDYEVDGFLDGGLKQYTTYLGYFFNWRAQLSGFACFFGADYQWLNFRIHYPYPNCSYNKIHSLVPTIGLRYYLIDHLKEAEIFRFNIVLEAGMSYIFHIKYENTDGYGLEALNNGFRPMLGIAITTSRFGSIHLRWTKDLYNLFNKDYSATKGFLYNNEIDNTFSCLCIGWTIFI